ncbi:hypothetical protein BZA77DRAFT_306623 [Pyronema omphalodes]|nr:hypothetical protein BZA77DRAFT_306623 [Pyronema omphalodes]
MFGLLISLFPYIFLFLFLNMLTCYVYLQTTETFMLVLSLAIVWPGMIWSGLV